MLRLDWGNTWDIGGGSARWRAARRDGTGHVLTRASADGLALALRISRWHPVTWPDATPRLRLMLDYGQIARLAEFRAAHPDVNIADLGFGGTSQARISEPNGETIITRYTLRELLDKLSGLPRYGSGADA